MKAFGDMLRTSLIFPFLRKQRAITQKLQMEKCRLLITALLHINVYKHIKFQDPRSKAFGDMLRTSLIVQFFKEQRAITPKLQMENLQFLVTALPLMEIYQHMKFEGPTINGC